MSDRRTKKDKKEHSKKEQKRRKKALMLKLDNGVEIPARTTYMENAKYFEIDEIDIDKIRISNKYSYIKENVSNKRYVFYQHNGEYIPLKIIIIDVVDITVSMIMMEVLLKK